MYIRRQDKAAFPDIAILEKQQRGSIRIRRDFIDSVDELCYCGFALAGLLGFARLPPYCCSGADGGPKFVNGTMIVADERLNTGGIWEPLVVGDFVSDVVNDVDWTAKFKQHPELAGSAQTDKRHRIRNQENDPQSAAINVTMMSAIFSASASSTFGSGNAREAARSSNSP